MAGANKIILEDSDDGEDEHEAVSLISLDGTFTGFAAVDIEYQGTSIPL